MLIAQITDPHILANEPEYLNNSERLVRVVAYLNELLPDLILLTGDLTDDGSITSYNHLKILMAPLKVPFCVIPGNHDNRENMRSSFCQHEYMPLNGFLHYVIENHPVRLIGLDTLVEGEGYGKLCDERLSWFEKTLQADFKTPTLIFMHHPPVKVGVKFFDRINCTMSPIFEELIRNAPNVIGTLTGHYHHLCVSSFGGKPCFLAPSIAPVHYFAHPDDEKITALEMEDPRVTLHKWNGKIALTSHVFRIKENPERIDWPLVTDNT